MNDIVTVESSTHGKRTFRRIGFKPYQRKNGTRTTIAVWQGACTICAAPFEVKTPGYVDQPDQSKSFLATTCPDHRLTPTEVARMRFCKAAERQGVFATIKAGKTGSTV
jgi:hypothetical protein